MKSKVPELILLLNIVRATGSCAEGNEYIYSTNHVGTQRCSDGKFFYYTLQYANESFCTDSNIVNEEYCWWDTTVESHCLESEECLWLDDNVVGGVCYCAETDYCEVCNGQTPAPTYSEFECPTDCKVFYVGCPSLYCNCFGECASAADLNCNNPIDPHCHIYYTNYPTDSPTLSPTFPKSVYWGCRLCCFMETEIQRTIPSVATVLQLDHDRVKIKSKNMVSLRGRRRTEVYQQWEILYEIFLEEWESTGDIIRKLANATVLNNIAEHISRELDIQVEPIETTTLGEDEPTEAAPSSSSSDSVGLIVGGIIGALFALALLVFVGYRLYYLRRLRQFRMDTAKMAAEGLCPVGEEDETGL